MKMLFVLLLLIAAAALEAGGDALIRGGLMGSSSRRFLLLALGGLVLFAYGCLVNLPRWDFGRLMGVYVAAFFAVAQIINWLAFGQKPGPAILVGGGFIFVGGGILTFWRS